MSLIPSPLDDRKFQQIVDEVRKRIPLYCPEWTDHNLSDPGITLVELFAWMVEMLLYRLNQVPDLHYIKFMEFLGYHLRSPAAAQTRVAFWLSRPLTVDADPQHRGQKIPGSVEVSTTQSELAQPVTFAVQEDFTMYAPIFKSLVVERMENGQLQQRALQTAEFVSLRDGLQGLSMFSERPPRDGEAVYFGFDNYQQDLSYHILSLTLDFDNKSGVGVNPKYPPYVWEAYNAARNWEILKQWNPETPLTKPPESWGELEKDTTRALNTRGDVVLLLPQLGKRTMAGKPAEMHWVRVRVKSPSPEEEAQGMRPYTDSPFLRQVIQMACVGALVNVANARITTKEFLGESDGSPGQRLQLSQTPVLLPLRADERLRVKEDTFDDRDTELWCYVDHFAHSNENSPHFTLDSLSGELRFGPAVRQPNGEIIRYGKTPPRNARLSFERYRYGGGAEGNVPRKAINVLKTSIPYVDRVENRFPVTGGANGQSVESAKLEVQRLIRTRRVTITPDDYEARVLEQFGDRIARVRCLPVLEDPAEPVHILLIPVLPASNNQDDIGYLTNEYLHVKSTLRKEIENFLTEISKVTTVVNVENCVYRRVRVVAELRLRTGVQPAAVERAALRLLHTTLHPTLGSGNGRGWPFEEPLTDAEVHRWLEKLPGVQAVAALELQEVEDVGPQKTAEGDQSIQARPNRIVLQEKEMFVSGHHQIKTK